MIETLTKKLNKQRGDLEVKTILTVATFLIFIVQIFHIIFRWWQ